MDIFPAHSGYSNYFLINFSLSLLTSIFFVLLYAYRRYVFVKPSMMILACYHVLSQWPLVLLSAFAEDFLLSPWTLAGLIHGFVLIGLASSYFSFNGPALTLWNRLSTNFPQETPSRQPLWILSGLILIFAVLYFAFVPFEKTGLYALIMSPEHAVAARETSLKLLDNWIPKYSLTFIGNVLTPLLTVAVTSFVLLDRRSPVMEKLFWIVVLGGCWLLSLLSGAKAIWSYLIIASLAVVAWRLKLRIPVTWAIGGVAAILAPAFLGFMLFSMEEQVSECSPPTIEASKGVTIEKQTARDPLRGTFQDRVPLQNLPNGEQPQTSTSVANPTTPDPRAALCAIRLSFSNQLNRTSGEGKRRAGTEQYPTALSEQKSETASTIERPRTPGSPQANPPAFPDGRPPQGDHRALQDNRNSQQSCGIPRPAPQHEQLSTIKNIYAQSLETNKRAFVLPTVVSIWYVDYVQRNNPIGIAGIPRLAQIGGIETINLPNRIGLIYGPCYYGHEVLESVSATTGFLFAQYGYFGLFALPLALLGLLLCDTILLVVRPLPNIWIVPTLAFVSLVALKFTQSDYLTIWITHGLGIGLLLIVILSRLSERSPSNIATPDR